MVIRCAILMLGLAVLLAGCRSAGETRTAPPPPAARNAIPAEPAPTPVPAATAYQRVEDLLRQGDPEAARQLAQGYFENTETRERAGVYSLILVARYYWGRRQYRDVVSVLAPIPRQASRHEQAPWALLTMAQACLAEAREGADSETQYARLKEAAGYLDTYIERYPTADGMPEVLFWSGVAEQQMGNLRKADDRYRRLRREYPNSVWNARLGPAPN